MMFLITMVLSSHATRRRMPEAERQSLDAINNRGVAPIYDDTASRFIVKDSKKVVCRYGHTVGTCKLFVTKEETKCSKCSSHDDHLLPVGATMYKCGGCEKMGFGHVYCTNKGCTFAMDGTYKKLRGGIEISNTDAGQAEETYKILNGCVAPFKFGTDNLDMCGAHVWRNEESGLLMLRSHIVNRRPNFHDNAWIIVKGLFQWPQLAASSGAEGSVRANAHLPPTKQTWNAYGDSTFSVNEHPKDKKIREQAEEIAAKDETIRQQAEEIAAKDEKIRQQAEEIAGFAALKARQAIKDKMRENMITKYLALTKKLALLEKSGK